MKEKYVLRGLYGELIEVSKEIYDAYYMERDEWRKQGKKERYHHLMSYNSLDTYRYSGISLFADPQMNVEEMVLARIEAEEVRKCIDLLEDSYNILYLISIGYTEAEIAEMYWLSRITVHRMKKRLLKELKRLLE